MRFHPALAMTLFLCGTTLCGQDAEQFVRTGSTVGEQIESILERVDVDKDRWVGEQDYDAIGEELKQIGKHIQEGEDFPPLSGALVRFKKLEVIQLKIVSSQRVSDEEEGERTRVAVLVELGGTATDGSRLDVTTRMVMLWGRSNNQREWVLKDAVTSPLRETHAEKASFVDVTERAIGQNPAWRDQLTKGINHWRSVIDEAVGVDVYGQHGVAVGDYDGDGWEDFYLSQPSGLPNRLFRNNGDGTFTDVSARAGVDILDNTSMSLFGDVDNDGDQDLVVLGPTHPLLFRNNGSGKFTDAGHVGLGLPLAEATMLIHMVMADYDQDGWLDLYVCSYSYMQPGIGFTQPTPYYDANNGAPNFLYRNRGDGTFEEVTARSGLMENNSRYSVAASSADYDDDGDQDLYVSNDFGRNNLYRNNGDGTFTDVAPEAGVEDMAAGMSVTWGDYDNDGRLDIYVGNMWSSAGQRVTGNLDFNEEVARNETTLRAFRDHARGSSLFHNNGDGTFTDRAMEAGVEMGRWAWSSDFIDYDNDGDLDINVMNGYITGADTHDL